MQFPYAVGFLSRAAQRERAAVARHEKSTRALGHYIYCSPIIAPNKERRSTYGMAYSILCANAVHVQRCTIIPASIQR